MMPLDVVALLVIWWAAYAALHGGHEVRDWRDAVLTVSLIVLKVCAFCGAIAHAVSPATLPWWGHGVLYSTAGVAAWMYDYRFGVGRHVRMFSGAVLQRLADVWQVVKIRRRAP